MYWGQRKHSGRMAAKAGRPGSLISSPLFQNNISSLFPWALSAVCFRRWFSKQIHIGMLPISQMLQLCCQQLYTEISLTVDLVNAVLSGGYSVISGGRSITSVSQHLDGVHGLFSGSSVQATPFTYEKSFDPLFYLKRISIKAALNSIVSWLYLSIVFSVFIWYCEYHLNRKTFKPSSCYIFVNILDNISDTCCIHSRSSVGPLSISEYSILV